MTMDSHASMNRIYRLVWSERLQAWVPVAEGKSRRRKGRGRKAAAALAAAVASLLFGGTTVAWAQPAPAPLALPTGGQVVAGQASIHSSTAAQSAQMRVEQASNRAAIQWQSFDLGSAASLHFAQPSALAVTLNRVVGTEPSRIFGRMTAPGQVFVLNPQGVLFGKGASVDVGGLVATTHQLSDADFMAGKAGFSRAGATGSVVNQAELRATLGGYIALLAPEVRNEGLIVAVKGTVALAAGERITLNLGDSGALAGLSVDAGEWQALVDNRSVVEAEGGQVILSARAAQALWGKVLNSGRISARTMTERGGRIVLEGGDIGLAASTVLDASGAQGGGTVHVGGRWQGAEGMAQAQRVAMADGATVRADATQHGPGGEIVLWSDVRQAESRTEVRGGTLSAKGGGGGRGGRIETSGAVLAIGPVAVDAGAGGQWLLDPGDLTVQTGGTVEPSTIAASLNAGTSVTLDTAETDGVPPGNLTVRESITKSAGGDATLSLYAGGNIDIGNGLSGVAIRSTAGALNLVMKANAGSVVLGRDAVGQGVDIATNGGQVWIGGGAESATPWNGLTVGSGPATANALGRLLDGGIEIHRSSIDTRAAGGGGGALAMAGQGVLRSGASEHIGVRIHASSLHTGAGDLDIIGSLQAQTSATPTFSYGVRVSGGSSLATTSGNLRINGTADSRSVTALGVALETSMVQTGAGALSVLGDVGRVARSGYSHGVFLTTSGVAGAGVGVYTDSGALALTGRNGSTNQADATGILLQASATGSTVDVVTRSGSVALTAEHEDNTHTGPYNQGLRLSSNDTNGVIRLGGDGGSYTGGTALTIQASRIAADRMLGSGAQLLGSGAVSIVPLADSFQRELSLNASWGFGSGLAGLTVGSQTNAQNIVFQPATAVTIAGPVSLLAAAGAADVAVATALQSSAAMTLAAGDQVDIRANLTAAGGLLARGGGSTRVAPGVTVIGGSGSGGGLTLKSAAWVGVDANARLQTDGAPITLWSNDTGVAGVDGGIPIRNGVVIDSRSDADRSAGTHTSGGGDITLAGGLADAAGAPSGYAQGNTSSGIRIGDQTASITNTGVRFFSGGGDITLRGRSDQGAYVNHRWGVVAWDGTQFNAGAGGNLDFVGIVDGSGVGRAIGLHLGAWAGGGSNIALLTEGGDIRLTGTATGASVDNFGTYLEGSSGKEAQIATTQGALVVSGSGANGGADVLLDEVKLLSGGSAGVSVTAPRAGGRLWLTTPVTLGSAAGSTVTQALGPVRLSADGIDNDSTLSIDTAGAVTFQPYSAQYTVDSDMGMLAVGTRQAVASFLRSETNGSYSITLDGSIRSAGDVTIQGGGQINMAADVTAGGGIALQSARAIWFHGASTLAAGEGGVTLAARAWGAADGWIDTASHLTLSATGAGAVSLGGGDLQASGQAIGATNVNAGRDGIEIGGNLSIRTEHGPITLLGRASLMLPAPLDSASGVLVNGSTTVSSIDGNILIRGNAGASTGAPAVQDEPTHGVGFLGSTSITTGASAVRAIDIFGNADNAPGTDTNSKGAGLKFGSTDNTLATSGSGGIRLWGMRGRHTDEGIAFAGGKILSASGPILLYTHALSGLNLGSGTTWIGAHDGSSIAASSADITFSAYKFFWNILNVNTVGGMALVPSSEGTFLGPVYTGWFNINRNNTPAGRQLSSLYIGGESLNNHIYVNTEQSVNGPVTLMAPRGGADVTISANITQTAAGAALLAKAGDQVFTGDGVQLQTRNGDLTLWSDADASGAGNIVVGINNRFNTAGGATNQASGGGRITLAGGAADAQGLPGGFATVTTAGGSAGIALGRHTGSAHSFSAYSGGGDITLRGRSKADNIAGLMWVDRGTLDAGDGRIVLLGQTTAGAGHGVEIGAYSSGGTNLLRAGGGSADVPAIAVTGSTHAGAPYHSGIRIDTAQLLATGGGGIWMHATAPGAEEAGAYEVLTSADLLSASGAIDIFGVGPTGILTAGALGAKAGTAVTSTSANVSLHGDRFAFIAASDLKTNGRFLVEPISTSFTQDVVLDLNFFGPFAVGAQSFTNLSFSTYSNLGGLVLGKPGNLSHIGIVDPWRVFGDVGLYGGTVQIDSPLNLGNGLVLGNVADGMSPGLEATLDIMANRLRYPSLEAHTITVRPTTEGTPLLVKAAASDGSEPALALDQSLMTLTAVTLNFGDGRSGDALLDGGQLNAFHRLKVETAGDLTLAPETDLNRFTNGEYRMNRQRVLVAGERFLNLAGPTALGTWDSGNGARGEWVVYSRNPSGDEFGGLVSGQKALWGTHFGATDDAAALGGRPTANTVGLSGPPSRFVFREPGVVNVHTADAAKTYGEVAQLPTTLGYDGLPFQGASFGHAYISETADIVLQAPSVSSAGSPAAAGAGRYAVQSSGGQVATGFAFNHFNDGVLTVNPALLTLSGEPFSVVYGEPMLGARASLSGFVNGETAQTAGITGAAAFSGLPAVGSGVGQYRFTPSVGTLAAPNYVVGSVAEGTLTITPRPVVVAGSRVYDGTRWFDGSALHIANAYGSDCAVAADCALSGMAQMAAKHAGPQALADMAGLALGNSAVLRNYTLQGASGQVSIAPKPVTVEGLATVERSYDASFTAPLDARAAWLQGMVAGDVAQPVVVDARYDSTHAGERRVASLSLRLDGADKDNYQIGALPTLSGRITPHLIQVDGLGVADKVYDGSTAAQISGGAPAPVTVNWGAAGTHQVAVLPSAEFVGKDAGPQVPARLRYSLADAGAGGSGGVGGAGGPGGVGGAPSGPLGSITEDWQPGDYAVAPSSQQLAFAAITPKPLLLQGSTGLSKVYDGLNTVSGATVGGVADAGHGSLAGIVGADQVGLHGAPRFDEPAAGSRTVLQGSLQLIGEDAGNYRLDWRNGAGQIARAPLVVRANDDAKFQGHSDSPGYRGAVATGLVNGETLASLGSVAVTRVQNGSDPGSYDNALVASGLNAPNYDVRYEAGRFTIVPAGQLLLRLAQHDIVYGNGLTPQVTEASYVRQRGGPIIDLTDRAEVQGQRVVVRDFDDEVVAVDLSTEGAGLSGAGFVRAGGWRLAAQTVSSTSGRIGVDATVVGSVQVAAKAVTVDKSGVSKVYDGHTAMTGLQMAFNGVLPGDAVQGQGSGAFAAKQAGTGLAYTLSDLALTGADAGNYQLGGVVAMAGNDGVITPRPITASGVTAADKVYDGLTTATVDARAAQFAGRVPGDVLALSATGAFADKNVGNARAVQLSGSLSGADAGNYRLTAVQATQAAITPRELHVSLAAADKVYDAGTQAVLSVTGDDRVAGDALSLSASGAFGDKQAGSAKPVSALVAVGGADAGNYRVMQAAPVTATISPKALALDLGGRADKVYDGSTDVGAGLQPALLGVLDGDHTGLAPGRVVRFEDKHAGSNKAVRFEGFELTGADASNYALPALAATNARISPRPLTLLWTATSKTYDGSAEAQVAVSTNPLSGDDVQVRHDGAQFDSRHVGTAKPVSVRGLALHGADAANYQGPEAGAGLAVTQADITPRGLLVALEAANKVYDGGTAAAVRVMGDDRLSGDVLALTSAGQFADKQAGQAKPVTATVTLSGPDAANYRVLPAPLLAAEISPRSLMLDLRGNADKVYDGSTAAGPGLTLALNGVLDGDMAALAAGHRLRFDDKQAGMDKPLRFEGLALAGADAANYRLSPPPATQASISPRPLVLEWTADSKVYDGSDAAQVRVVDARLPGDVLALDFSRAGFDSRHVGQGKPVSISGLRLQGPDAANYRLPEDAPRLQADIRQAPTAVWIGGATGLASDPANWQGGVLPDGRNVAQVVVAPGQRPQRDILSEAIGWPVQDLPDQAVQLALSQGTATAGNPADAAAVVALSAWTEPTLRVGGLVTPEKPAREEPGQDGLRWSQSQPELHAPGVYVQVLDLPAPGVNGLVQVGLNLGLGNASGFLLPDAVLQALGPADGDTTVEVVGRKRLPEWLHIDKRSLQVTLRRLPARALPLALKLSRGDRALTVQLQPLGRSAIGAGR